MSSDRLHHVEDQLKLLREQQKFLEREILITPGLAQSQAEQRLRLDIKPKLRQYEEEYWRILAEQSVGLEIAEPEAELVVAEIVEQVGQLEVCQDDAYTDEVVQILHEIRDKLNQPGTTAAAKLKGVISSIPPFIGVSYEAELDTENFWRTHCPTFTKWYKALAKKL